MAKRWAGRLVLTGDEMTMLATVMDCSRAALQERKMLEVDLQQVQPFLQLLNKIRYALHPQRGQ